MPILVPRDGPIAALDPDRTGLLARPRSADARRRRPCRAGGPGGADRRRRRAASGAGSAAAGRRSRRSRRSRWSWWPSGRRGSGSIRRTARSLFESILEKGQTYSPPEGIEKPLIWAGNSGSVYVRVGETLHGPLGSGTKATRDVVLEPKAIAERYDVVAERARGDLAGLRRAAGRADPGRRDPVTAGTGARGDIPRALAYGPALSSRRIRTRSHDAQSHPPLAQHRPAPVAADPCRAGAGGRRRADQRADDDEHADHRRRRRRWRRCRPAPRRGRTSCGCRARTRTRRRALQGDRAREPGADRGRHPFPLPPRHRGGGGGGGVPAGSIRATSARRSGCAR